jgi:hypothetical protein
VEVIDLKGRDSIAFLSLPPLLPLLHPCVLSIGSPRNRNLYRSNKMQENIGFFKGLKILWTGTINTMVMISQTIQTFFHGLLHGAEMFDESMEVAHTSVSMWTEEQRQNLNKLRAEAGAPALPPPVAN